MLSLPFATAAHATQDPTLPTNLVIELYLSAAPSSNNFTRYMTFTDTVPSPDHTISVPVAFTKTADLHYTGKVTTQSVPTTGDLTPTTALNLLQSLVDAEARMHWDSMKFQNQGGSTSLSIAAMTVVAEYKYRDDQFSPTIATATNVTLGSGTTSITLSGTTGRRNFAQAELGINSTQFYAYPDAVQEMVYDLGKGGSSSSADAYGTNPKYGDQAVNLCSETITWYYANTGVTVGTEDFEDMHFHADIRDVFQAANRLYCYHNGHDQWFKVDTDGDWVLTSGNYVPYLPQAGDYLDRADRDLGDETDDGHAMMIVEWDATAREAIVMDGPHPVAFRLVEVEVDEDADHDFCVGRIP